MTSALRRVVNIDDLRTLARKRVPRAIFDYVDGGADGEVTLRENRRSWDDVLFRPRNAVNTTSFDTRTKVLGTDLAMPMFLAPIGFSRLLHPDGELATARAAADAGIAFCMSTFSGHTIESVASSTSAPLWFQLYLAGGREVAEAGITRAWKAGFKALAVTIDTNIPGNRERDVYNGTGALMAGSLAEKLPYVPQILARPGWLARFLMDRDATYFPNVIIPGKGPLPANDVRKVLAGAVVTWEDMKWIRAVWPGPILAKGVLTADDARRALDEGCAGVIVSNHGGRQLDTCYPTTLALPEVMEAVGERTTVIVDGGIRRGSDIVKALCMGAKAVFIGRAYAYGLAAESQAGIARAVAILKADLERTLAHLGCGSIRELGPRFIHRLHT